MPILAGQRLTAGTLNHIYAQADATTRSVTSATFANISSQYVINANDAAVGTAYRLTTWGTGTQGSTPQSLGFRPNTIGGAGISSVAAGSGFAAASQGFRWWARATFVVSTTGSGGALTAFLEAMTVQTGTANAATSYVDVGSGFAVNTAANWGIEIDAEWAATTGAPTISCAGTLFERLG